jgi:PAS domain S-box-containing protein
MSRTFWRRFLIIAISLLLALLIGEGIQRLISPTLNGWTSFLLTLTLAILASALGLFFESLHAPEDRLPPALPKRDSASNHLEADLLQLNRQLEERASQNQNELARLNVELSLEIARHQQAEAAARKSEERFRNLAEHIQEGLTIFEDGKIVYVNDRACEIFGDCPDGSLLDRANKFALPDEIERLRHAFSNPDHPPTELQYWIKRKDGERRCVREHYSVSRSPEERRIFIVTSDVTERVQAYQTLEQAVSDRTRELSTVLEISRRIASTLELEPLLNLILDQIGSILPYSGAAIYTLEEGNRLQVAAYYMPGLPTPPASFALALEHAGLFRPVITEKKIVILDDVHHTPPLARIFEAAGIHVSPAVFQYSRAWIGIPFILRDRVMGMLSLTYKKPGFYTQTHARLAQTITNQIAIAIENARLYGQAQDLATLEERNRIARELHDSVTQLLYGISLYSTAATRSASKQNLEQVKNHLMEIKDNSLQALQEMRLLILELDPPLLQKHGLVAALRASLESIETRAGLETALNTDGISRLPASIEPDLYRIAMEALNNLVRYARAKKVTVNLHIRRNWVILDIWDNGVGFELEYVRNSGGLGIHNMKERAKRLRGYLDITSSPGVGTHIRATIPLYGYAREPVEISAGGQQ